MFGTAIRACLTLKCLQGWKGSVKATHFVIALHDHFTGKTRQALWKKSTNTSTNTPAVPETVNHADTDTNAAALPLETPVDDSWALDNINIRQIQPLIEAIDDDGSSFVTVNELNDFTNHRPKGWRRVHKPYIYPFYLTCVQSSSLDRLLDDRLRDDDELVLATDSKELRSYFRGFSGDPSFKPCRFLLSF